MKYKNIKMNKKNGTHSLQFLFKSTHHSWTYERKCEWVFFSEHSVCLLESQRCGYDSDYSMAVSCSSVLFSSLNVAVLSL